MAGYIGKSQGVTQVDGYNRSEADAEFLNQTEGDARYVEVAGDTMTGTLDLPTLNIDGVLLSDGARVRIPSSATEPTSAQNGDLYYNSANNQVYVRTNGVWAAITASMPTNGLQFWLPLAGNTNDASGNSRNGTASGITYTNGPSGTATSAALFNSGDTLSVSYTAPAGAKTIAFWYKALWNSQTDAWNIGFQGNSNGNGFMFMQGVGNIYDLGFWGYGGSHDYNIGTSYTNIWASNNQWHHIAAVWNGSNSLIYLDGVVQTQYFNGSTASSMNLASTLGVNFTAGSASADVSVAGVAVWDRVLSAAEIVAVKEVTGA